MHEPSYTVSPMHQDSLVIVHGPALCRCASHCAAPPFDLMQIADAEQEAVLTWVPHKAKEKNKSRHLRGLMMPHLRQRPHVHLATSLRGV